MEFTPTHIGILYLPQKTIRKLKNLNFMNIRENEYEVNSYLYNHNKQKVEVRIPAIHVGTCKADLTIEMQINNTVIHLYRRFLKDIQPITKES